MKQFTPVDKSLFFSRQDPKDPRLGDLVQTSASGGVAIVGYPDDEGIRLNGGREGAAAGPDEIRRWLYKMTPHPKRHLKAFRDLGDLESPSDLGGRHELAAKSAEEILGSGSQLLSFGGGNDWAYADGMGFLKTHASARPLIINIDAHLDVRSLERGLNSGTPFYRLLESGIEFDFVEFGIQTHCNSKAHWEYVQGKGGRILTMEEYFDSGLTLLEYTVRELGELILKKRPVFLAVDIDAFSMPFGSGTSAPSPLGILPQDFWPLYLMWLQRLDVRVLGIYEVSPPLDVAASTAKWAAQLAHGFYTMFEDLKFSFSLGSDNHSGVHPRVMEALSAANRGHAHAYGMDELCQATEREFKRVFGLDVESQYVFTGTAANVLSMATQVRSFEAVICSEVAHLHLDECGAPEKFLGAKLWTLPSKDGKISPDQCASLLERMGDQHFSQPKCVSLTLPSELGVCYSLEELRAWRKFTRDKNLMLHLDGARLANAAAHLKVSFEDLTRGIGADVVSLGGTKNGLMGAEAVLLFTPQAKAAFKFYRKQAMQLSSKTRFLAAQFHAYLKNDLWRDIAEHTTGLARDLEERLAAHPEVKIAFPVHSNALFVQLPKPWIKPLRDKFFFYIWDSETQMCRWMISWDWTQDLNAQVIKAIEEVKHVQ